MGRLIVSIALSVLGPSSIGRAQESLPPTVQRRYAVKDDSLAIHALGTLHLRGDVYHQVGFGAELNYYPSEDLGVLIRYDHYEVWLSEGGKQVQEETGFVPRNRPQHDALLGGVRWSIGYGKVQLFDSLIAHFDPQWVITAGTTFAEARVVPTLMTGLGLLVHLPLRLQTKIDLLLVSQWEDRGSGVEMSIGFAPVLSFGIGIPTHRRAEEH